MSSRFLDIFGMEHYHQLIKPEEVQATQTTATNQWTGEIAAAGLAIGKMISYILPSEGNPRGATTLNLTLSDGTTTGAKNVYENTGGNVQKHQGGMALLMVYNGTDWRILNDSREIYTFEVIVPNVSAREGANIELTMPSYIEDADKYTIMGISQYIDQGTWTDSNPNVAKWRTDQNHIMTSNDVVINVELFPQMVLWNDSGTCKVKASVRNESDRPRNVRLRFTLIRTDNVISIN